VFVGRVTRQKGLQHLLRAALRIDPAYQLVVCAGTPDTAEIAAEVGTLAERVRAERGALVWIEGILPRSQVVDVLSVATVCVRMGKAGRRRVLDRFSWQTIADRTVELYRSLLR